MSNEFKESQTSAEMTVSVTTRRLESPWGILAGPEDMDAMAGSDVILECLLTGQENVEVSWKRTGKFSLHQALVGVRCYSTMLVDCRVLDLTTPLPDVTIASDSFASDTTFQYSKHLDWLNCEHIFGSCPPDHHITMIREKLKSNARAFSFFLLIHSRDA